MSRPEDGSLRYDRLHEGEDLSYVQKVMESLSDGVGSLLLAIIPLQDNNAPLPPELPASTEVVAKLCDEVVSVATELGEEEYGDYPKMQKEIFDACDQLTVATKGLLAAVRALGTCQPAERSQRWNDLGDAVKVIVAKTIQLLEIVYNCEILRLWEATKRLLDAAKHLNPAQAAADAVGVRDKASDLATKAKEVASYMHDVAAQQPSELVRNELNDAGNRLDDLADRILAATNELLRDRANPDKQKRVKDLTAELEDALQRAQAALDALQLMGDKTADGTDTEKLTPLGSDWETSRDRDQYDTRSGFDPEDELAFAAKKAQDGVRKLLDKSKQGDRPGTDDAARHFQKDAQNTADLARELADDIKNRQSPAGPASSSSSSAGPSDEDLDRARRLEAAAEQLRDMVAPTNKQARELAGDHGDAVKRSAAESAVAGVVKVLEEISDEVRRKNPGATIDASVRKIHVDADQLAHGPRTLSNVEEAGRDIEKELAALRQHPGAERAAKEHRETSDKLLPMLIEEQLKSLHEPGHRQNPRIYDALVATVDVVGEKTKPNHAAELIEAADRSAAELRKLKDAALQKSAPLVKQSADEVVAQKDRLHRAAEALVEAHRHNAPDADGHNVATRVAGALADYDAELPAVLRSGVAVIRDGGDAPQLRNDLERDLDRVLADLQRLVDLANAHTLAAIKQQKEDVAVLAAAVVSGDKDTAVPTARAMAARQPDDIRRGAEALAERVRDSNPAQYRAIHDRLDELDRLLPGELQAAREVLAAADPHSPAADAAKQRLQHAGHAMTAALDQLADSIQGDRAAFGRPQPFNKHHEELATLLPAIVRSAEDGNFDDLLAALDKASRQIGCLPLDEHAGIQSLVDKEKRCIDELEADVHARSPQDVVEAAKRLAANNNKLADAAVQAANKLPLQDPHRKQLQDAADSLHKLFPTFVQSAKDALRDPAAERDMHAVGHQMKEVADSIAGCVAASPFDRLEQLVDAVKAATTELDSAAKAGHVPQTARAKSKLDSLSEQLGDAIRDAARATGGPDGDALRALAVPVEKAVDDVGHSGEMLAHQPHNRRLAFALDDEIAALIRLLEDTIARSKAAPLAAIEREEKALQHVLANPASAEQRDLLQHAQEQLREAVAPLHGNADVQRLSHDLDETAVPAVVACRDPAKLPAAVVHAESDLKQLRAVLNPSLENAIAAACKQEEAGLLAFRDAARDGDRPSAAAGLTQLKAAQEKLVPLVEAKIGQMPPAQGQALRLLIDDLKDKIANELAPAAGPALANAADKEAQARLDGVTDKIRDVLDRIASGTAVPTAADEVRQAGDELDDLVAFARDPRKRGDRRRLIELAASIADRLRNLIENARREALAKGLDTGELDRLIRALDETQAGILAGTHTLGDLDTLLQRFSELQKPAAASSSTAPLPPLPEGPRPEPVTLDEKLQRVAEEVHEAHQQTTTTTQSYLPTGLLAEEFRKLALAAKEGDRSAMILIGRNIHALIAALVAKILQLANACKDKYLKDRLLRFVDPLRNYSTQLKILCSVKAATNKPDADADDQLASITRSLGNIVSDTVKTVDTGIKTKRLAV